VQQVESPADKWRECLMGWGIPGEILDQAPQSPWVHPPESFKPLSDLTLATPSWVRAKEALDACRSGSQILDIGCGGGRGSLGLAPPAIRIIGVDQQQTMLDMFAKEASSRSIEFSMINGQWPDVAEQTPICDVVVCHHVFFNVAELQPFVLQLASHARRRVVVEIPMYHPLSNLSPAWKHFWNIDRPQSPTAFDAVDVIRDLGIDVHIETFEMDDPKTGVTDLDVEHTRIRLCLDKSRDPEVREFLINRDRSPRTIATIWWDTNNE
jgi:SAM-dependent methyltransferase